MPSPHSPKQNHILSALPAQDYARLLPDLELIPMPLGWAVYESGGPQGLKGKRALGQVRLLPSGLDLRLSLEVGDC